MAKPGRPALGKVVKGFYIEPELEIRMMRRLTPFGQAKPPHGAVSELINALIRQWLAKEDNGPAQS